MGNFHGERVVTGRSIVEFLRESTSLKKFQKSCGESRKFSPSGNKFGAEESGHKIVVFFFIRRVLPRPLAPLKMHNCPGQPFSQSVR